MFPRNILGSFTQVFFIIFLSAEVYSQNISRYPQQNVYFSACNGSSYCVPMRRCLAFRNRSDWRTAGVSCGSRRVCCPRRPEIPINTTFPEPTGNTTTRTVRALAYPENTAECGRSQRRFSGVITSNVTGGEWPWMAAIRKKENFGDFAPWCTGFLIDRKHVLSAAHCFDERHLGLYRVRIGNADQEQGDEYSISQIAIPEDYRTYYHYNDIAILTLSRDVNSSNFVPVCLPDEQIINTNLTGMGTTVTGWGAERPNGMASRFLQELRFIPVVSNEECYRILRDNLRNFEKYFPLDLTDSFLCAGFTEGEKDACGVDAGAPLMFEDRNRWFAVGITSFGYVCGQSGVPTGYTRVSSYLEWIRKSSSD